MSTLTGSAAATTAKPFEFGDPAPNAVGRKAVVSHEGCVVHLEASSAPRLVWYGEDLLAIKMPPGTREIYPNPTIPGLRDYEGAIRWTRCAIPSRISAAEPSQRPRRAPPMHVV